MKWRRFVPHIFLFVGGLGYAGWSFVRLPFPLLDENPLLDLVDYHTPNFYGWVMLWYYASPFVAVMLAGLMLLSVWKVWLEGRGRDFAPFGGLPAWPAALVLEVKGDFCHDIRRILIEAGRGKDYIELGMKGHWQWNPLSAWWLDSYSLAYTVSSLLNQLFGKGKEPFWQQAYTNLVRWIIELHRALPERWVTLRHVYRCAIDPELFAAKIEQAEAWSDELNKGTVFVPEDVLKAELIKLAEWTWKDAPDTDEQQAVYSRALRDKLDKLKLTYRVVWEPGPGDEVRERVEAVKRWFVNDWQTLDNKIKSSIVEGVSVFLAMFDLPDVAKVFCPDAPEIPGDPQAISIHAQARKKAAPPATRKGQETQEPSTGDGHFQEPDKCPGAGVAEPGAGLESDKKPDGDDEEKKPIPGKAGADRIEGPRHLPPLYELIEQGKVLALNMPAGSNPALARAVGVMLKNAWLQALRTRIFLSLSDDASAKIASELCGQVAKIKGSYTISETSKRAEVSPLSGRAGGGGGSIGATKSFREQRETVFHLRDFALLGNCQAICLPYDGAQSLEPRRVYLKPHYLPLGHSYWRAKEAGRL